MSSIIFYRFAFFIISLFNTIIFASSFKDVDLRTPPPPVTPLRDPTLSTSTSSHPFRPTIGIIVGVLAALFLITFLLLLYAKNCYHGEGTNINNDTVAGDPNRVAISINENRKNSGIEKEVIQSLPLFRFRSLQGPKDGLDCAVCLTHFDSREVLRLLPKCKHAFHVECVDTWLVAHSTCPLCRYKVDPEDILLIEQPPPSQLTPCEQREELEEIELEQDQGEIKEIKGIDISIENEEKTMTNGVISGRDSSGLERSSTMPSKMMSFRRSLDNILRRSQTCNKNKAKCNNNRRNLDMIGCLDSYSNQHNSRKRRVPLTTTANKEIDDHNEKIRLEHRINIVPCDHEAKVSWSDMHRHDQLYLKQDMIFESQRSLSTNSGYRLSIPKYRSEFSYGNNEGGSSNNVLYKKSVSEVTSMNRFPLSNENLNIVDNHNHNHNRC